MSTATPIADLLGIDASSKQIATAFEFRGATLYWCAPTPNQPETLLRGRNEFWSWLGGVAEAVTGSADADSAALLAEALALFLTPDTDDENESADAIIAEVRAAIAAQGGAA